MTSPAASFLSSHRATTACARALELLADVTVAEVDRWCAAGVPEKPTARRTPGRCVVQVGPVALSMTWLPPVGNDLAAGELLIAVWHGTIGVRPEYQFERVARSPRPVVARELWEQVFHPGVVGVDSWRWIASGDPDGRAQLAADLAAVSVTRLRDAYSSITEPAAGDPPCQ